LKLLAIENLKNQFIFIFLISLFPLIRIILVGFKMGGGGVISKVKIKAVHKKIEEGTKRPN
jgi:hypothetical protein